MDSFYFSYPSNSEIDQIYKKFDFNPVGDESFKIYQFQSLLKQRKSLFNDFLKFPLNLLENKEILEFGTASGEKTLVYAHYKSKIYAVESNKKFIQSLKKNFQKFNLNIKLKKITLKKIENYKDKKKYDFVIAENFLGSTKKRVKNLNKLFSFVKNDGFLLISYTNKYGYFFDFFKSFLLKNYFNENKISDLKEMLNIAKKYFFSEFIKSSNTRKFEKFCLDQLILNTNLERAIWSFEEIMKLANKNKFKLYSSYPNYFHNKYWYKDIKKFSETNLFALKEYNKIKNNFIFSGKKFQIDNNQIIKLMEIMEKIINRKLNKKYLLNFLSNHKSQFFKRIIKAIRNNNPKNYKKIKELHQWGHPNHYLIFMRD